MLILFLIAGAVIFFGSCEMEKSTVNGTSEIASTEIDSASVLINEFCAKASLENEFGKRSDWVELYNNSGKDIQMEAGKWTITDNPSNREKFYLPETIIPAGGHLVIWCDGEDIYAKDIHTNFKLSSKGESIELFYEGKLIDSQFYDSTQFEKGCKCRTEDGADEWISTDDMTPSKTNS